jgi:hypothetical protein
MPDTMSGVLAWYPTPCRVGRPLEGKTIRACLLGPTEEDDNSVRGGRRRKGKIAEQSRLTKIEVSINLVGYRSDQPVFSLRWIAC